MQKLLSRFFAWAWLFSLFQNCAKMQFATPQGANDLTNAAVGTSASNLDRCETPLCRQIESGTASCTFNGREVRSGESVDAFLASVGSTCVSERRQCTNGVLSGTYQFATCTTSISTPASCLFNGRQIAHGSSVTAYVNSSGSTCTSEQRLCQNGVLSGTYQFATCTTNGSPRSCLFNGRTIPSGSTVTAFVNSSVDFGKVCESQLRLCTDGTLNGSYAYESCMVGVPKSCMFNGQQVPHGGQVLAYARSSVGATETCSSQMRMCDNGVLSGSYTHSTCQVQAPASCQFNGANIAHGQMVTAFSSSTVPYGQVCMSENRLCNNGALSGTYVFATCNVQAAKNCMFNGTSLASGQTVTAFQNSTVAAGAICQSETRTCTDGNLSGSYNYSTCTPQAPMNCTFAGQNIASGASVRAYFQNSVPFGSTCQSEERICNNGNLSGSASHLTCMPTGGASCPLPNGGTLPHGSSAVFYASSSVSQGSSCMQESRSCNNGSLSGSYQFDSCVVQQPTYQRTGTASCQEYYCNNAIIPSMTGYTCGGHLGCEYSTWNFSGTAMSGTYCASGSTLMSSRNGPLTGRLVYFECWGYR